MIQNKQQKQTIWQIKHESYNIKTTIDENGQNGQDLKENENHNTKSIYLIQILPLLIT